MKSSKAKIAKLQSDLEKVKPVTQEEPQAVDLAAELEAGIDEFINLGIINEQGEILQEVDFRSAPHKNSMACLFSVLLTGE